MWEGYVDGGRWMKMGVMGRNSGRGMCNWAEGWMRMER